MVSWYLLWLPMAKRIYVLWNQILLHCGWSCSYVVFLYGTTLLCQASEHCVALVVCRFVKECIIYRHSELLSTLLVTDTILSFRCCRYVPSRQSDATSSIGYLDPVSLYPEIASSILHLATCIRIGRCNMHCYLSCVANVFAAGLQSYE